MCIYLEKTALEEAWSRLISGLFHEKTLACTTPQTRVCKCISLISAHAYVTSTFTFEQFPRSTSQGVTPTVAQPHADLGAPLPPPLAPEGVLPPEGVRSSPPPLAPVGVRSRDWRASRRAEPARGEGA